MQQSKQAAAVLGCHVRAFLRDATDTTTGNIRMVTDPTPKQRRQTKVAIAGYALGIAALFATGSMPVAIAVTGVGIFGGILLFGEP